MRRIKVMELKDIRQLNAKILGLDRDISKSAKVTFIASLIIGYKLNNEFLKLVDFDSTKPIDELVDAVVKEVEKSKMQQKTKAVIITSINSIAGVNTILDHDKAAFKDLVEDFVIHYLPEIRPEDTFLETLYMLTDKKSKVNDTGVILTPKFAASLMIDLLELDYKRDVVFDGCCGTGIFSILSYIKMRDELDADYQNGKLTEAEYGKYLTRLSNAIIANDISPKMVTLCFANYLISGLNPELLYCENVHDLDFCDEEIKPTKAILNPPYEDKYKPIEIIEKNISLVKNNDFISKVVAILPPQKFGQNRVEFAKMLNSATLETVIKMQDDLFKDSGIGQAASIFVFNATKYHEKTDLIHYYNFTDTGYVYLKDSGLVDKNHTYESKKADLLKRISDKTPNKKSDFVRTWTNFYEVNKDLEIVTTIDPDKVKTSKEEADITLENITIKKMLEEKEALVKSVNNNFIDEDGSFENYIIDILSED